MNTTTHPQELRYADPAWLAQSSAALKWLDAALDRLCQWDEHSARILDQAYRERLARLLRTHAEAEDFRELNRNILRATSQDREKGLGTLDQPYAVRWLAFSDILDDRLLLLGSTIPEALKERPHVRKILEFLDSQQEVAQQELGNLDIGEANLSRILSVLEGWEVVVRHRRQREKFVSLGPRANELLDGFGPINRPSQAEQEREITRLREENARVEAENAQLKRRANQGLMLLCPVPGGAAARSPSSSYQKGRGKTFALPGVAQQADYPRPRGVNL